MHADSTQHPPVQRNATPPPPPLPATPPPRTQVKSLEQEVADKRQLVQQLEAERAALQAQERALSLAVNASSSHMCAIQRELAAFSLQDASTDTPAPAGASQRTASTSGRGVSDSSSSDGPCRSSSCGSGGGAATLQLLRWWPSDNNLAAGGRRELGAQPMLRSLSAPPRPDVFGDDDEEVQEWRRLHEGDLAPPVQVRGRLRPPNLALTSAVSRHRPHAACSAPSPARASTPAAADHGAAKVAGSLAPAPAGEVLQAVHGHRHAAAGGHLGR